MESRQLAKTKKRQIVILSVLAGLLALLVYFLLSLNYASRVLGDQLASKYFSKTACQVISKKLSVRRVLIRYYRADFLVRYHVNEVYYRRWVSGNGLDESYSTDAPAQEDILTRFANGEEYPCYYDPHQPGTVILVLRHEWGSVWPVVVISVMTLIILYVFLRNLFILLRLLTADVRTSSVKERKRRRKSS